MKDACCSSGNCDRKMFRPRLVPFVAGLIVVVAGISKYMGGAAMMTFVGNMALGIVHVNAPAVATVLGYIVATIEILGGISVMFGCRITSKYAACLLAIIMAVAFLFHLTTANYATGFIGVFSFVQLDLLLLVIFLKKSCLGGRCCKTACCASEKSDMNQTK